MRLEGLDQILGFKQDGCGVVVRVYANQKRYLQKMLSIKTRTRRSESFKSPRGVTAPGTSCRIAIRSSGEAKESGRVPFYCRNFFRSTRLSPLTVIR